MSETSFYRGAALSETRFAMLASPDGRRIFYPHTRIVSYDISADEWRLHGEPNWYGSKVARYAPPEGEVGFAVLSNEGDIFLSAGESQNERVDGARFLPRMHGLRQIGDRLYATGGAGAHFYREPDGNWAPLLPEAYDPSYHALPPTKRKLRFMGFTSPEQYDALSDEEEFEARRRKVDYEASIYAIDGPAHDDLYLAGLNATLIHFDGTEYHRIETGQESSFTDVILHEGEVYIIGAHRGSVILKGTAKEGFAPIAEVDEDRLWFGSMCFWQGALYVGDALKARGGVYRLEGDQLRKLPGLEGPIIRLEAAGGVLWALQEKALHRFDGESWQHFESPFG